jgi:magnesium-protoporphyrin O-methyltransferase
MDNSVFRTASEPTAGATAAARPKGSMPAPREAVGYSQRRSEIEHYFDRTAAQAWARLTSDAPVGRIRATVRAGRDRMRNTLLQWLPDDLSGCRLLDAGCGTGALAVEAARRGAEVVAIDLSPTLVELAAQRVPKALRGSIRFLAGDMLDPALGRFDHVVAMDSLIHYRTADAMRVIVSLADRTSASMLFTFAPSTPLLAVMHAVGRMFPRGDRAPSIVPVSPVDLARRIDASRAWQRGRSERVASGFYTSQALELLPSSPLPPWGRAGAEPGHKQSSGLFVPGEGPGHWPGAACKVGAADAGRTVAGPLPNPPPGGEGEE